MKMLLGAPSAVDEVGEKCYNTTTYSKKGFMDFFGRRSLDLVVRELPLKECVKFWGRVATRVDTREIIDVLSVTGGVPRYLREIAPGDSAVSNIAHRAEERDYRRRSIQVCVIGRIGRMGYDHGASVRKPRGEPLSSIDRPSSSGKFPDRVCCSIFA